MCTKSIANLSVIILIMIKKTLEYNIVNYNMCDFRTFRKFRDE